MVMVWWMFVAHGDNTKCTWGMCHVYWWYGVGWGWGVKCQWCWVWSPIFGGWQCACIFVIWIWDHHQTIPPMFGPFGDPCTPNICNGIWWIWWSFWWWCFEQLWGPPPIQPIHQLSIWSWCATHVCMVVIWIWWWVLISPSPPIVNVQHHYTPIGGDGTLTFHVCFMGHMMGWLPCQLVICQPSVPWQ